VADLSLGSDAHETLEKPCRHQILREAQDETNAPRKFLAEMDKGVLWFNPSDPAAEEALYDMESMRRFAGIDLGNEPVPDETTICKFRHLHEAHDLGQKLFESVSEHLQAKGLRMSEGTIMDATIISAPPSTKNNTKTRDPEMRAYQEGQPVVLWHEDRYRC